MDPLIAKAYTIKGATSDALGAVSDFRLKWTAYELAVTASKDQTRIKQSLAAARVSAKSVGKPYWSAFQVNNGYGNSYAVLEVKRVFGSSKEFHPQQLATRQDAAIALQVIDQSSPPKLASPTP